MKTLILVNCQSDYITGTVSRGARKILEPIKKYIKINKDNLAQIIFVVDWHPFNHCSFKKYGGELQYHCIQYTPGACIEPKLLKYVQSLNIQYSVAHIGEYENIIEKGAFSDIEYASDNFGDRYYLDTTIVNASDTNFIVAGIGDNLIGTVENLLEKFSPKIFAQGCCCDYQFIKSYGLEIEKIQETEKEANRQNK